MIKINKMSHYYEYLAAFERHMESLIEGEKKQA